MPATATMKAMSPSDIRVIANMDAKRSTLPALARSSDCLVRNCSNLRAGVPLQRPVYRRRLVVALGGRGRKGRRVGQDGGGDVGRGGGWGFWGRGGLAGGVVRQAHQGRQVRFGGWLPLGPGRGRPADGRGGG